jgi:hypothetical protein
MSMDRQQADALVRELGVALGMPDLALDEAGTAVIAIGEGDAIVSVGFAQSAGTIELMICLDKIALTVPVMLEVLGANFAWIGSNGATFAIDGVSQALVLMRRCRAPDCANGGLFNAFGSLVATAEAWSERLVQSTSQPTEQAGTSIPAGMVRA